MKWKYLVEELKLLGWKKAIFRVKYELSRRWYPYIYPIKTYHNIKTISLKEWHRQPFFLPDFTESSTIKAYRNMFSVEQKKQIVSDAQKIIHGQIQCFSKWWGNYGNPIDWHKNPQTGVSWPQNIHYSQVYSHAARCGDIKLSWELNRFPHLYTLGRAYLLTSEEKYAQAFFDALLSWEQNNPYRVGINWANGQELAIRSLAWIWAMYIFGNASSFNNNHFQRLQRLIFLHGEHIYHGINYARYAVHNNHLIGEALGLYAIGSIFPWLPKAKKWRNFGKKILENDCLQQFHDDGGYCQNSHTYHRLATHYYIWYCRIAESIGDTISQKVYLIIKRSADYFTAFINTANGYLNNWGCNDGALLCPWTMCCYRDFRPVISAARYLTEKKLSFTKGPWEEELFFLFGAQSLTAKILPCSLKSQSFPTSGLHSLRIDEQNFIVFRCGSVIDRFGQADQLHVSLFWKGLCVATDAGTYSYYDKHYHQYFMGTKSHNTVTVDDKDQMYLHRPFKWLYWTKAKLLQVNAREIYGEHYSYPGVIHHRKIKKIHKDWQIEDFLVAQTEHKYILHWLIDSFSFTILYKDNYKFKVLLTTVQGSYYLQITSSHSTDFSIDVGWQSSFYQHKQQSISICAKNTNICTAFCSYFTATKENMSNKHVFTKFWNEYQRKFL